MEKDYFYSFSPFFMSQKLKKSKRPLGRKGEVFKLSICQIVQLRNILTFTGELDSKGLKVLQTYNINEAVLNKNFQKSTEPFIEEYQKFLTERTEELKKQLKNENKSINAGDLAIILREKVKNDEKVAEKYEKEKIYELEITKKTKELIFERAELREWSFFDHEALDTLLEIGFSPSQK